MTDSGEFDALLDHANRGKEHSVRYMASLDVLDNVVRECMHVSHGYGGIRAPTARHVYASVLFTCLITKGVSLISLAPHSTWAAKTIEHWDYASAAVIARTMLETRLAYYYLCTDPCTDEEWQCRWNVFNLHDCTARRRLFDALGDVDQVAGFDVQAEELRDRLRGNEFFNTLPDRQRKKLLNGQTAYLKALEDIADQAGIERSRFRYLYVLLSSHVHSLPMSFYRLGGDEEERGRGLPSPIEENYTSMCHLLAAALLTATRDEVHRLFAGLRKRGNEVDPAALEEQIEELVSTPDNFPVGETAEMFNSDEIKIVARRVSKERFEFSYYHLPSECLVLTRIEGEQDVYLQDVDPFFWAIDVNGAAATESIVERVGKCPYAFKVDHINRRLAFKTDQ